MKFKLVLFFTILFFNSISGALASMIIPSADRILRMVTFGADAMMLLMAILAIWPRRRFYGVQYFVAFALLSFVTFLYNIDRFGIMEHLNGLRDTLFFFSSLIVLHDLFESRLRHTLVTWFTGYLIVFALLQIPFTFYQFLKYGAGDLVGGTYGIGGGSGFMSQGLFLIVFYLVVRFASSEEGDHFKASRVLMFLPLLIPCALNETKISFVLLAGFLLLMSSSLRQIYRTIPVLVFGAIMFVLLDHYYSATAEDTRNIFDLQYIEKYLYTNQTEVGGDLPRFQRLVIMFRMMGTDVGAILFGLGYGVFGGGNIMGVSRVSKAIYYLVTGSRILLFRVWVQGGLLAVIVIAGVTFAYLRSKVEKYFTVRRLGLFVLFSLLIIWFYDEALLDRVFAPIIAFLMLWVRAGGVLSERHEGGDDHEDGRYAHA
jgi:hypothetical protein